ncbi:2-phospho-L-lactate guanylyltransferase [Agromyces sp. SYSU K20354]|uniref:2-phospho-L-lactate guanylyltransferase n=1 Tax=Agromyces cavernae TaxID=2898659 RepID=UPI001E539753|nr:2-phospho-L-lactate guanylyltransferase [Agromyces cavernae]MCD2441124.1 2-phospho-L-lactate guanylyltransferase [Agromyces cavernae]
MTGAADAAAAPIPWTVVIPVKGAPTAKTRLAPAVADDARAMLARAFALDTIAAALAARSVARVIVVGDDPALAGEAEFLAEPEEGPRSLVRAIAHGIAHARHPLVEEGAQRPSRNPAEARAPAGSRDASLLDQQPGIAVLLGDLPALRPEELDAALDAASRHPLAFVRDADGTGTTLATAAPAGASGAAAFEPHFGPDSAARHLAAGFVELAASDLTGLTRDVDTVDALEAVLHHGVGDHTAEVVAHLADRKGT